MKKNESRPLVCVRQKYCVIYFVSFSFAWFMIPTFFWIWKWKRNQKCPYLDKCSFFWCRKGEDKLEMWFLTFRIHSAYEINALMRVLFADCGKNYCFEAVFWEHLQHRRECLQRSFDDLAVDFNWFRLTSIFFFDFMWGVWKGRHINILGIFMMIFVFELLIFTQNYTTIFSSF